MLHYRIQSGKTQPAWLTIVYSVLTVAAFTVLFLFALPFILAIVAVLAIAGIIAYWRIKSRLKNMKAEFSSTVRSEDAEYVDFEVVEDEDKNNQ